MLKKIIYKIVKIKDGEYVLKMFNIFYVKVEDIHIGYGGCIIRTICLKSEIDCKKLLNKLYILQTTINWKEIVDIDYKYKNL